MSGRAHCTQKYLVCFFVKNQVLKKNKMSCFQVSWIWEPTDGQRDNIAVFHPMYGQSFPNLSFKDRVVFLHNSLENPSIRISNLKMSDAGRYTCEYATYPSGNEQGTTTLIMLGELILSDPYLAFERTIYHFLFVFNHNCYSSC